jgi:hypothetical protein
MIVVIHRRDCQIRPQTILDQGRVSLISIMCMPRPFSLFRVDLKEHDGQHKIIGIVKCPDERPITPNPPYPLPWKTDIKPIVKTEPKRLTSILRNIVSRKVQNSFFVSPTKVSTQRP